MLTENEQEVTIDTLKATIKIRVNIEECVTLDEMAELIRQALLGLGYHVPNDFM